MPASLSYYTPELLHLESLHMLTRGGRVRACAEGGRVRWVSMGTSAVDRVLAKEGVRFAYLFGSRATQVLPGDPVRPATPM